MKKKSIVIVAILLVFSFYIGRVSKEEIVTSKIPANSSSMIAMYIQDEEGNYQLSDAHEFPKDGYVLNTEKSSCKNGGKIIQNASTKALSLKVKTSDECTVYFDVVTSKNPAADMLIAKANAPSITDYNSGNKQEMFAFDHPEATQTTGWTEEERRDYRYIGNQPNNYITFNDETWRIIGVFTVETESGEKKPLMKIIRDQSIGNLAWDSSNVNEWSTASLQKLLNEDYYNQTGSYTANGLNATARSQIAKVKWHLGGANIDYNLEGTDYYNFERGTETCVTTGKCSGKTRTTSIMQNVGIMYPSDYVYTYANGVNDKCYTDGNNCNKGTPSAGWLYIYIFEWTQSPSAAYANRAFFVNSNGSVYSSGSYDVSETDGVRPTVFLDSKIAIKSGDGSQANPYVLSTK